MILGVSTVLFALIDRIRGQITLHLPSDFILGTLEQDVRILPLWFRVQGEIPGILAHKQLVVSGIL